MSKNIKIVCTVPLSNLKSYLFQRAKLNISVKIDKKRNKQEKIAKKFLGKEVILDLSDLDQRYLLEEHIREPENIFTYVALSKAGLCNNFIDIGANYGHEALILVNQYEQLVLVEPNPKICPILSIIFSDKDNVEVVNAAVVGENDPKEILLKVPIDSSALASTVDSPLMREEVEIFTCKGVTLNDIVEEKDLNKSYIKIDVEGAEYAILSSSKDSIMQNRAIVGFEALSREMAQKCADLFTDYTFYYARFDFIDDNGSLKSISRLVRALMGWKNSISVYKIEGSNFGQAPNNYSQVYCVPFEKQIEFEQAVSKERERIKILNLSSVASYK